MDTMDGLELVGSLWSWSWARARDKSWYWYRFLIIELNWIGLNWIELNNSVCLVWGRAWVVGIRSWVLGVLCKCVLMCARVLLLLLLLLLFDVIWWDEIIIMNEWQTLVCTLFLSFWAGSSEARASFCLHPCVRANYRRREWQAAATHWHSSAHYSIRMTARLWRHLSSANPITGHDPSLFPSGHRTSARG